MFRHDAAHTGVADSSGPTRTPVEIWRYNIGDIIESSPAVVEGVLYIGSDKGIYAINASTGDHIWNNITAGGMSSPAVDNGVVYIGSAGGFVQAFNASTGTQIFRHPTGGQGVSASPLVINDGVYIGVGLLMRLNTSTGHPTWTYRAQDSSSFETSPAVVDGIIYVGADYNIYAVNASLGTKIWNYTIEYQPNGYIISSPSVSVGVVYIGSGSTTSTVNGQVWAVNATSGTKMWNHTVSGGVVSSPAVFGRYVYAGAYDGTIFALDRLNGREVWSYQTGDSIFSSPAVANGIVYVGSNDGYIYALDGQTGEKLWSYQTEGPIRSSPTIVNGVLYVGSYDGYVYALTEPTNSTPSPTIPEFPNQLLATAIFLSLLAVVSAVVITKKRTKTKL